MSKFVEAIDQIQNALAPLLKEQAFKKKGRTYNKKINNDVTNVINFQMGQYQIGPLSPLPELRDDKYGQFTVNLGVYLPAITELERTAAKQNIVQEYDCQIRQRLSALAHEGRDIWWDLHANPEAIANEIRNFLNLYGFPFFGRFSNYQKIISHFKQHGDLPFNTKGRSQLVSGLIFIKRGDRDNAANLFQQVYDGSLNHPFHKYVKSVSEKVGLTVTDRK